MFLTALSTIYLVSIYNVKVLGVQEKQNTAEHFVRDISRGSSYNQHALKLISPFSNVEEDMITDLEKIFREDPPEYSEHYKFIRWTEYELIGSNNDPGYRLYGSIDLESGDQMSVVADVYELSGAGRNEIYEFSYSME